MTDTLAWTGVNYYNCQRIHMQSTCIALVKGRTLLLSFGEDSGHFIQVYRMISAWVKESKGRHSLPTMVDRKYVLRRCIMLNDCSADADETDMHSRTPTHLQTFGWSSLSTSVCLSIVQTIAWSLTGTAHCLLQECHHHINVTYLLIDEFCKSGWYQMLHNKPFFSPKQPLG